MTGVIGKANRLLLRNKIKKIAIKSKTIMIDVAILSTFSNLLCVEMSMWVRSKHFSRATFLFVLYLLTYME